MKIVLSGVVIIALLLGGGYLAYTWSGARGDVVKKKVLSDIDKWLGESDVRRAEIDRGIKGLDEGLEKMSDARIKAQVQAEMLGKEVASNKKKIEESKAALVKLKDDLKAFDTNSTYTVSYGTKTYTKKEDLDKMARKVIDNHTALVEQTESMEKRLQTYELTATTLTNREAEGKKELADMRNRLKELDAKIELVKAQKAAAEALDENDKTFADSIAGIKDKIRSAEEGAETAVRKEDKKWKDLTAKTEVEDASKLITNSKNTVNEIDELLGKK
jgi:chromosome segregation ATPase